MDATPWLAGARSALREMRRSGAIWFPLAAGFFWTGEAARRYPASYIFVPDLSILSVQLAQWAWLVLQGIAVASVAALACALFARDAPARERPFTAIETALALGGVTALALFLRTFWSDVIPPAPWWDAIFAMDDSARAGRFLGPHEAMPLLPGAPGRPVLVFGLYLDFVRVLLLIGRDRQTVFLLMNALPASLIPAALFLLARRITGDTVALASALLAATTVWPLVLARWGWDQQLMSLLVLLALERAAAAIEKRRTGAAFAAGLLAGAACQTYVAGLIVAGGLAAWMAIETRGARRLLGAFVGGATLLAAPMLLAYRSYPPGGRVAAALLSGGAGKILADVAAGTYLYVGELFFTPDRNPRHGPFNVPHQDLLLLLFFLVGGASLVRRRVWPPALRGLLVALVVTLLSGILSEPNLAPNGYRTGLAGLLVLVASGVGFVAVTRGRAWTGALLGTWILLSGTAGLLAWSLAPLTEGYFGDLEAIGRFVEVAGPSRVVMDPRLVSWGHPSYHGVAFFVRADRPLEPLVPLRYETPPPFGLAALDADWFVTYREPALPGVDLSAPGLPFASLRAVNLHRLRGDGPRSAAPPPAPPRTPRP